MGARWRVHHFTPTSHSVSNIVFKVNAFVEPRSQNFTALMGTSNNSFVVRIVSSRGARNPHVSERTFRLLRSGLLTLHPQK